MKNLVLKQIKLGGITNGGGACSITTTKVEKTLLICNWQSTSVLEIINYTQLHKIKPKKPQLLKFIQLKKIEISKNGHLVL